MKRATIVMLIGVLAAAVGLVGGWYFLGPGDPPGEWKEMPSAQKWLAYQKELDWAQCRFTPINESEAVLASLRKVPVRLLTSILPEDLDRLRVMLFNQIVSRYLGSMEHYVGACTMGRQAIIDERNRDWLAKKFRLRFNKDWPERASPVEIFEVFWREEYEAHQGGRRFREVCLEEGKALIVIGEVRGTELQTFFTPEEQQRSFIWSGARRLRSAEMYLSARPLEKIFKDHPACKQAEVALIIRSFNDDVWCWHSQWYLEPGQGTWQLCGSIAVCSRRQYDIPI